MLKSDKCVSGEEAVRYATAYIFGPVNEFLVPTLNKRGNGNAKLIAPRISFLDFDIRWKSNVFDSLLLPLGLLFWFPTGELLPIAAVLGEEGLIHGVGVIV
jgi:hypothetical protein